MGWGASKSGGHKSRGATREKSEGKRKRSVGDGSGVKEKARREPCRASKTS